MASDPNEAKKAAFAIADSHVAPKARRQDLTMLEDAIPLAHGSALLSLSLLRLIRSYKTQTYSTSVCVLAT